MLSATAPLVQAWYARIIQARRRASEPYVLYAGQQPRQPDRAPGLSARWSSRRSPCTASPAAGAPATALFILLIGAWPSRSRGTPSRPTQACQQPRAAPAPGASGLIWVALAAIPSSLMLGVTTYITTDVASAPFLWVLPLALYLGTFIIAFQDKPAISPELTLAVPGRGPGGRVASCRSRRTFFVLQLVIHLAAFFFTALMCHQALVAPAADPSGLTEFYLWLSLGGVVGGAFNALRWRR